jgi:hypothetical protein
MLPLLKIEIQFSHNHFSLLWPIDTKLGVLVADIKTLFENAINVSVIKVKVTVTKNRNLAYWHQTWCVGSLYQEAAWDCYPGVYDQGHFYLKVDIQFQLSNLFALAYWHQTGFMSSLYQDATGDNYAGDYD